LEALEEMELLEVWIVGRAKSALYIKILKKIKNTLFFVLLLNTDFIIFEMCIIGKI
jgi:hypothetical protein